jgi:hypothetical protein
MCRVGKHLLDCKYLEHMSWLLGLLKRNINIMNWFLSFEYPFKETLS